MGNYTTRHIQTTADAVQARIDELGGLNQIVGSSDPTLRRIARGDVEGMRPSTLRRASLALGWTGAAIQQMLEGAGPPADGVGEAPSVEAEDRRLAELYRLVSEVLGRLEIIERRLNRLDHP